jgi:hypothetical protein
MHSLSFMRNGYPTTRFRGLSRNNTVELAGATFVAPFMYRSQTFLALLPCLNEGVEHLNSELTRIGAPWREGLVDIQDELGDIG